MHKAVLIVEVLIRAKQLKVKYRLTDQESQAI